MKVDFSIEIRDGQGKYKEWVVRSGEVIRHIRVMEYDRVSEDDFRHMLIAIKDLLSLELSK